MTYETFSSEVEANEKISEMAGWYGPNGNGPEATRLYLPDDPNADSDGNVWIIEADHGRYLLADGYVR